MQNLNSPSVPVKVQQKSGFDKSHFNLLTSTVGTITPVLIDEVMANSDIYCKINLAASMPPLAADTFMKCDIAIEAFYIPMRLCYGGFESWYCERDENVYNSTTKEIVNESIYMPVFQINFANQTYESALGVPEGGRMDYMFGHRGLPDFMGFRVGGYSATSFAINPLPFVAYHLVWDNYYRSPLVQKSCFASTRAVSAQLSHQAFIGASLPDLALNSSNYIVNPSYSDYSDLAARCYLMADMVGLFELRQRNFGYDYFTLASPKPQLADNEQSVNIASNKFTISSLRVANSLQQFSERNNLAGARYVDTLRARTGAVLKHGVAQMPVLLGACKYNCYNKSVQTTAQNFDGNTNNPFAQNAGGVMGNMYSSGSDIIIDGFHADEPGYILVNMTLVPTATYSSGVSRLLLRYLSGAGSIAEMADALLQNTGNQPIYACEIDGQSAIGIGPQASVFGYTEKFSDFKTMPDEIHGLFRKGLSLEAFVSQRYYGGQNTVRINSSFLQIPKNYLDDVLVYNSGSSSSYGYWAQIGFDYKVSMPLAQYALPSLQNPAYEHGDTVIVHRGGFRF